MKNKLTKAEKKILGSYQRKEWKPRDKRELPNYVATAKKQIKEERINIRLAAETLERIRQEAMGFGIPYQTLIASILYRYAHDRLQDERYIKKALKILKD